MANYKPIKLAYSVFEPHTGSDERLAPIIFLHGVSGGKETWMDILQYIANGSKRTAYAIDIRNHGSSEYTEEFNLNVMVEDLFYFMDIKHFPKSIIVGHSLGGLIAIKAALMKPDRIEMIFVEDMYSKKLTREIIMEVLMSILTWAEAVRNAPAGISEDKVIEFAIANLKKLLPPNSPYLKDLENTKKQNIILKRLPDGKYDVNYNCNAIVSALKYPEYFITEPCGQFKGPAFFIYGSISPFQVGQEKDEIRKHFRGAEFIEIEGAAHHVHSECPTEFKNAILHSLKKIQSEYIARTNMFHL